MSQARSELELLAASLLEILPPLLADLQRVTPAGNAGSGVTRSQVAALRYLAEYGSGTMQDLAKGVGVTAASMTATVKLLIKNGLADRRHEAADWRTVRVTPTEAGRRALEQFTGDRIGTLAAALQALSPEQRALLMVSLPSWRALAERVGTLAVPPAPLEPEATPSSQ